MFEIGKVYHREELHRTYGGHPRRAISIPQQSYEVFLFYREGKHRGYGDGWTDEGTFLYYGEGQRGDMQFSAGNMAVRDHVEQGRDLHLFQQVEPGRVRYLGRFVCRDWTHRRSKDVDGNLRRAIVFELLPLDKVYYEATEAAPDDEAAVAD